MKTHIKLKAVTQLDISETALVRGRCVYAMGTEIPYAGLTIFTCEC